MKLSRLVDRIAGRVLNLVLAHLGIDLYLSVEQTASYSTLSRSFIEKNLRSISHFRVGKRILIKKSDFDAWLERYRVEPDKDSVKQLVDSIVEKVSDQK